MTNLLERSADPTVKAVDIAFVIFNRLDLDKAKIFMEDFGLTTTSQTANRLYMRAKGGYGPCYIVRKSESTQFGGIGLVVPSDSDLEKLAALGGSSEIQTLDHFEGAKGVLLHDPSGMEVWAICGVHTPAVPSRKPLHQNIPEGVDRVNNPHRPPARPSEILRLGHAVLPRIEFAENLKWYLQTFGMITTDTQSLEDGTPAVSFIRCDLGAVPADHHSVVIVQGLENGFSHCAFETVDLDDIAMGQEFLMSKGHTHAWGVGRHTLGSQIFDYWRDPWGDKVEHYCDSDKFTSDHATQYSKIESTGNTYQWGPPPPSDFEIKMTPGFIWRAIQNIYKSRSLDFSILKKMSKLGGAKPRQWL